MSREGLPGEPGQPGEAGHAGGGAGGAGGAGGRGGRAGFDAHGRILIGVIVFVAIFAIALSTATLILVERQDDAIQAARRAEYRICVRQMINRAAMDFDVHHDEPHLPLYDCTPNLYGRPATPLTPAEADALRRSVTTPGARLP